MTYEVQNNHKFMIILFILGLVLGGIAVVFALQNVALVTVTFFSWHIEGSLAMILILSIISGILITLLLLLPGTIQTSLTLRRLKKETKKLEEELRKQKELTVFAKHDIPTSEAIEHIEHGSISSSGM